MIFFKYILFHLFTTEKSFWTVNAMRSKPEISDFTKLFKNPTFHSLGEFFVKYVNNIDNYLLHIKNTGGNMTLINLISRIEELASEVQEKIHEMLKKIIYELPTKQRKQRLYTSLTKKLDLTEFNKILKYEHLYKLRDAFSEYPMILYIFGTIINSKHMLNFIEKNLKRTNTTWLLFHSILHYIRIVCTSNLDHVYLVQLFEAISTSFNEFGAKNLPIISSNRSFLIVLLNEFFPIDEFLDFFSATLYDHVIDLNHETRGIKSDYTDLKLDKIEFSAVVCPLSVVFGREKYTMSSIKKPKILTIVKRSGTQLQNFVLIHQIAINETFYRINSIHIEAPNESKTFLAQTTPIPINWRLQLYSSLNLIPEHNLDFVTFSRDIKMYIGSDEVWIGGGCIEENFTFMSERLPEICEKISNAKTRVVFTFELI